MNKILTVFLAAVLITGCASISRNPLPDGSILPEHAAEDAIAEDSAQEEEDLTAALNAVKKPMVALTFDDGPGAFTDAILDILERYNARATFFVQGQYVERWQNTVRRAIKNGNEVAGHTWNHPLLTDLSNRAIAKTIEDTTAIIEQVTGIPSPRFFRAPYGHVDRRVVNVCAELGYAVMNWTVDPQDWRLVNANLIYNEVMQTVKENAIVVLHDILKPTATAIERIVPALIAKGYELVTVSEVMDHLYGGIKSGMVYGAYGLRH